MDVKYRNEKDWWWGLGPETARSVMESNWYEKSQDRGSEIKKNVGLASKATTKGVG